MPVSRRDLLRLGLGAGAAAALTPGLARHARAATASPRLVLVTAFGGWDQTFVLDPKLGSPLVDGPDVDEDPGNPEDRETTATFGGLTVGVNAVKRPAVSAFFQRWATRTTIVRGLDVATVAHESGKTRVTTGLSAEGGADLAAIVADAHGRGAPLPYLDLGATGRVGPLGAISGRTGDTGQARLLLDRALTYPGPASRGVRFPLNPPSDPTRAAIDAVLRADADALVARWGDVRHADRLDAWYEALDRAEGLRADGPRLAAALPTSRDRSLVAQADAAVTLLREGLCHCASLDTGLDFDTHDANVDQHGLQDTLFAGLDRLMSGLQEHDLLDNTAIVVLSELGRTPRLNAARGKDHWSVTTAMLLGGPFAGGRTWGATDDGSRAVPVDLRTGQPAATGRIARYDHLAAGILRALDVDPEPWLPRTEALDGLTP